jgi:hypothetical protein
MEISLHTILKANQEQLQEMQLYARWQEPKL